MSLMSNRCVLQLRRAARAMGVPRLLGRLAKDYESAFSKQLMSACRSGDTVWDVGANVGHYAISFSHWVGPSGRVFAFEPSHVNLSRLRSACRGLPNVELRAYGLSDKAERARFLEGSDHSTSRVLAPGEVAPQDNEVELRAGDAVIRSGEADLPNVVKIDVEGHEFAVLRGLQAVLADPRVRSVFVEVHFGILDMSGRPDDPKHIEAMLKGSGFKVRWTDPSHIHAYRPG